LKNLGKNRLIAEEVNDFMDAIDEALIQLNTVRLDFGST
jgi:hypothetical protein